MKKSLSIVMMALLALAWYVTISSWTGMDKKYQAYIDEAKRLEGKGLYLDAIAQYEEAKTLKPDNLELEEYIADAYFAMRNLKEYQRQLNYIIDTFGPVERDVEKAYEYYKTYSSESSLISYLVDLYGQYPDNSLVKEYYNSIKGIYTVKYVSYDDIRDFRGNGAVYEQNGKWGILNKEGETVIKAVYDDIAFNGSDTDRITVKDGNSYYLINSSGYKTQATDEEYEYMGVISGQRIIAKKDGKFGYLDGSLNEKIAFTYDNATSFYEEIAAVEKNGKWALINNKGEELTEYIYDDVAINSKDYCSVNKVVWVKQGDVWILINNKGEVIGTDSYDDVKAFESSQLCAVCKDGRWGFADSTGSLQINYDYQDAKSFLSGYAPVKKNDLWGYIDLENYMMISCDFEDARQMTASGVAPVAMDGVWTLIELEALN